MNSLKFEDLREMLNADPRGSLIDSLIAVECGVDDYHALWDAHVDCLTDAGNDVDPATAATIFLVEMSEIIGFDEIDFDKLLKANV